MKEGFDVIHIFKGNVYKKEYRLASYLSDEVPFIRDKVDLDREEEVCKKDSGKTFNVDDHVIIDNKKAKITAKYLDVDTGETVYSTDLTLAIVEDKDSLIETQKKSLKIHDEQLLKKSRYIKELEEQLSNAKSEITNLNYKNYKLTSKVESKKWYEFWK